ncbi:MULTISPECIES: ArsC family reductase [Candidatus Hamiltonella]|uniref:Arsenate reductase-like protein, ArsC domain protein n=2 Tax=Candidatus Williamhamiltonella defendens TaxID=138072 RepID=C4K8N3_HAMD5|nr:ArsC family reductase [Candidatus Hamiltonella defensa]ACQ66870.1 arsenate reductase-like protein, ArsC domain protein [Candidatus Hamiltonella defensa 5AT (Acyrthosiphon pisum)]ATW21678.1 ArsC family reductase [Candidatus Hamiltonella defensa]ATW32994.1 ArsC family reductase [Candidatus Hamiltonella defensa]AYB49084.1 ArsC family reductase [Candidatus Hamiltonella defensa]
MYTLYGIKNCDTIKKTRSWLNEHHVIYRFHDYQVDGLTPGALQNFIACLGWTPLLNTRGTTWRRLSETERAEIRDAASAHSLMLQKPAIIKRPILESSNGVLLLGFNIEQYRHFLKHS